MSEHKEPQVNDKVGPEDDLQAAAEAAEALNDRLAASGSDYDELPGRHITPNQIVAYNVAYYRKAAGLTQEELGNRLRGWTTKPWGKAGVSAVERSWDGKRLRQFDADLLFGLAVALDVPVMAFFLPPEIDGVSERYLIHAHNPLGEIDPRSEDYYYEGTMCRSMREYILYILSEPSDDSPTAEAYRSRLSAASTAYLGVPLAPQEYFEDLETEEQLTERIGRIRNHHQGLREMLGDLEHTLDFLYERLGDYRDKQAEENPELARLRRRERNRKQQRVIEAHDRKIFDLYRSGKTVEEIQEMWRDAPRAMVEHAIERARKAVGDHDEIS